MNVKYLRQREIINLNYLMDHILYQILKIIFSIIINKHETVTDNPPLRIF